MADYIVNVVFDDKNTIDMILNMYHDGISRIEISKSLKINYKSICYIINKHK